MSAGSKAGKAGGELGLQLLKQATVAAAPSSAASSPVAVAAASPAQPEAPPLSRREELIRRFEPVFLRHPALRNVVSGRGEKGSRAVCVPEMLGLLECLNASDYNQRRCLGHIGTFQRCVEVEEAKRKRRKELIRNPESGRSLGGRLAASQVNALLAKFPTPPRVLGEREINRRGRYE